MRLVGRRHELSALIAALQAHGAVVHGPAGVGKSRLLEEAAGWARREGWHIDTVRGTAATASIPYGAFAAVLPADLPSEHPSMFLGAARRAIAERRPGRHLLVVDDAHVLDPGSLALVEALAEQREPRLLLATRETTGASSRPSALSGAPTISHIDVRPLSPEATAELAEGLVGGDLEPRTRRLLWQRSRGNPLFLRELVESALKAGTLRRGAAGFRLEVPPPAASGRLRNLVEARLGGLAGDDRTAAEVVALAEPLPVDVLTRVVPEAAAERLEQRGVIETERSGDRLLARVAHPLAGEILRQSLPSLRRRRLARALTDAMRAAGLPTPDDVLRAATLQVEADAPHDAELLSRAAEVALRRFDHHLAERLARAAADAGAGDAWLVLGEALSGQGRGDEAEKILGSAMETGALANADLARAAMARARNLAWVLRRPGDSLELLNGIRTAITDVGTRSLVDAQRVLMAAVLGDFRTAAALGDDVLADERIPARSVVDVLAISKLAQAMLGRLDDAWERIDHGLELAVQERDAVPLAHHLLEANRVIVDVFAGRAAVANDIATMRYREALTSDLPGADGLWAAMASYTLVERGKLSEARRAAMDATALLARVDPVGLLPSAQVQLALVLAQLGQADTAHRQLQQVPPAVVESDMRVRITRDRALVWISTVKGRAQEAARLARDSGRAGLAAQHVMWAVRTLHDAVRLGHPDLVVEDLATVAERVDGALVPLLLEHATALSAGDGEALDRVSQRFESLGMTLLAAEAAQQAAAAHRSRGDLRRARRATARAGVLGDAGGGSVTVAAPPVELTPREQEVAILAARGLTSTAIAEGLGVSVRTVDNHLGAVYGKLGVDGRHQLGDVLLAGADPREVER